MAASQTLIEPNVVEPITGNIKKRYKIVIGAAATTFTLSDTSWANVYEMSWHADTASAGEVISSSAGAITGSGFANNDVVYLTVIGTVD